MNATTSLKPFDPASIPSRLAYGFQPLKPRTLGRDLRDLFTFIWTQDTETFDHPRYRLQTALAIQLVYYLGLHPTVALSEGFYYQDTRLLLKKHNNTVRVLLLICLEGREKFPKTEKHWRGGTMILTDLPRDRHICPVTLFLALAIVDGAIEGINCSDDFSTLAGQDWSGCITLPFNSTVSHLSIFRRTGSKSKTISSCAMKPSAVYKMMQAQMIRAGHENTLSNMVHDVKKSSRRFTQHAWQSEKPLVIGRGQAEDVSELLGQIVEIHSTTPIVSYDSVTPRPLKVIPELVKIQLRYDSSRRDIISCLYGMRSMYGQVIDMLWCFVNAAVSVAPEPFYKDALPDANGQCSHCGLRFGRLAMKTHLLRCSQKQKIYQVIKQLAMSMQEQDWVCKWEKCPLGLCSDPEVAAAHMSEHIGSRHTLVCHWNECKRAVEHHFDLHDHLLVDHGVYTHTTIPTRARFCIECAEWFLSDLEWDRHITHHLQHPNRIYGPVIVDGVLAAPRRCPYCNAQGIFQQIDRHSNYIDHVERHLSNEASNSSSLKCPHQACERKPYTKNALKVHFRAFHAIPLP